MRATCLMTGIFIALAATSVQAQQLQPGEWSISSKVIDMEGAGLPTGMADALANKQPDTHARCILARDASLLQNIMTGKDQTCSTITHSFAGGVLDLTQRCKEDDGGETEIHLHGPVTPTSFALDITNTRLDGPKEKLGGLKVVGSVTAERQGDCK